MTFNIKVLSEVNNGKIPHMSESEENKFLFRNQDFTADTLNKVFFNGCFCC